MRCNEIKISKSVYRPDLATDGYWCFSVSFSVKLLLDAVHAGQMRSCK